MADACQQQKQPLSRRCQLWSPCTSKRGPARSLGQPLSRQAPCQQRPHQIQHLVPSEVTHSRGLNPAAPHVACSSQAAAFQPLSGTAGRRCSRSASACGTAGGRPHSQMCYSQMCQATSMWGYPLRAPAYPRWRAHVTACGCPAR